MSFTLDTQFVTETCCYKGCGVMWAFTEGYYREVRRSHANWYCPNGHSQHYTADSDAEKLRKAEAREVALKDQLSAAIRDAERVRVALLRDRQRFANGVCPCCNRSFENVRRHMATKHPDYDIAAVKTPMTARFRCSCGRAFESVRGLRTHQGHARPSDWDAPNTHEWRAHLTKV